MDLNNKPENEITNLPVPGEEEPADAVQADNAQDEEFAKAVAKANEVLVDDEDEAPAEHVPTAFEKKMHAIPENKWILYQIIGGIVVGIITVVALFGGEESSFAFITAVILALLGPNQFEKSANRKIYKGRVAMCITIAVGLVVMFIFYMATGRLTTSPTA